jgi:hypothetical protein
MKSPENETDAPVYVVVPMPPDVYRVSVAERHIEQGIRNDCANCAVSKAINETYPHVFCDSNSESISVMHDGVGKCYETPPEVDMWMRDYDSGELVSPIEFTLFRSLPEGAGWI